MLLDPGATEFEWGRGNTGKNRKHGISDPESEEAFFDERKVLLKDTLHSGREERFILLGRTKGDKLLVVVFTKRRNRVRIISARRANRKEVPLYEKAT